MMRATQPDPMKSVRLAIAMTAMLFIAGCVQSEDIVLKNPNTGQIHECKTDSGASFLSPKP
jgi:hypothetical protein